MDILELRIKLSNYKMEKQSFFNDMYLWVNMTIKAIDDLPVDELVFEVPSAKNGEKTKNLLEELVEKN